jgi:hypothetical protein
MLTQSLVRPLLVLLAACAAAPQKPAPVAAVENRPAHTCSDAAVGLDRATKGVRAPDAVMFDAMRVRCIDDVWSTQAIECFAMMHEGDLGTCARELHDGQRTAFFDILAGGTAETGSLAVARARLDSMVVPVEECDRFVKSVSAVLGCEQMPIDDRVQLGNETADFWNLPAQLPEDAHRRIADACGQSLVQLRQHATFLGCML